jgi:hypothetical protein
MPSVPKMDCPRTISERFLAFVLSLTMIVNAGRERQRGHAASCGAAWEAPLVIAPAQDSKPTGRSEGQLALQNYCHGRSRRTRAGSCPRVRLLICVHFQFVAVNFTQPLRAAAICRVPGVTANLNLSETLPARQRALGGTRPHRAPPGSSSALPIRRGGARRCESR